MLLLRAFERIAMKDPTVRLVFVGDGMMREEVQKQARQSSFRERIRFTGHVEGYSDLRRFMIPPLFRGSPELAGLASFTAYLECLL